MKKLLLLISAIALFATLEANPIVLPYYSMTEFAIEANGDWVIELALRGGSGNMVVDSITIKSSTGSAKWKNRSTTNGISLGYIVLRNDSMLANLSINPLGDYIEVFTYSNNGMSFNMSPTKVAFGNYPNSIVKAPKAGQSISTIPQYLCAPIYDPKDGWFILGYQCGVYSNSNNIFSLDNSPTIGFNCDSTGMYGTLKGHIYDTNGKLITDTKMTMEFPGNPRTFSPKADGSYSTFLFANNNKFSTIYKTATSIKDTVDITPIDIDMDPDSVIIADIHLTDFIYVGIPKVQEETESIIKIFPNPVKDLSINYEIEIPVKSANSFLEVINLEGQKIAAYTLTNNIGKIELPDNIKNGMYSINLFVNNKRYSTTKVLIAR